MRDDRPEEQVIKVVDRRRFDAAGEVRDRDAQDTVRKPPPPPEAEQATARAQARRQQGHAAPAEGGADFLGFAAQLGTQALASLGALPEAQARGIPVNLEMARELIDILTMLGERTRGNLSPEEDASFKRLVAELQMHYVRQTRGAAAPGPLGSTVGPAAGSL